MVERHGHQPVHRVPAHRAEQLPEGANGPYGRSEFELYRGSGAIGSGGPVAFLRRRHRTIVVSLISTLTIAAVVTLLLPPVYRSDTTVLVEARSGTEQAPALDALAILRHGGQIETEIELIRSRRVLEPVLEEVALGVTTRPRPNANAGADGDGGADASAAGSAVASNSSAGEVMLSIVAGPALPPGRHELVTGEPAWVLVDDGVRLGLARVEAGVEQAVTEALGRELLVELPPDVAEAIVDRAGWRSAQLARLAGDIGASRAQRDADLIRITCEARSASAARALCRSVQQAYLDLRLTMQRGAAAAIREFLDEQLVVVQERLRSAEDSLEAYRTRFAVVALDDRASAEVRALTDIQARRDVLDAERAALEGVLEEIRAGGSTRYRGLASFPSFLHNEAVTSMISSLVELENRRSELAVRRTDANPDLAALDARIRTIEEQLLSMGTEYASSLRQQVRALDSTLGDMSGRLSTIPQRQVDQARLAREAEQEESVYRMLGARMSEARIAEAVSLPNVRVVDEPSLPAERSSPRLGLNLLLGTIGGLSLGLGLALFREQLDAGIRDRDEVERRTGLSVLTMVPHVSRPGPMLPLDGADAGRGGRPSTSASAAVARARRRSDRTARFAALEAYRGLATELRLSGRGDSSDVGEPRSLAVTSALRGEGKTLTACNLALVYASKGRRTLLVDSDMRASGVARFFSLGTGEPGLSDVLAGRVSRLDQVVQRVGIDGGGALWILPAGQPTTDGTALLDGDRFARLLNTALESYDLVVFDTPPFNLITDAAAVAAMAEGALLVVRAGITDREHLEHTLRKLQRVRGNVLGVVLNDARMPDDYRAHYEEYAVKEPAAAEST